MRKRFYVLTFLLSTAALFLYPGLNVHSHKTLQQTQWVDDENLIETPKIFEVQKNIPLYFIQNKGQVSKEVLFYAHSLRYSLWITSQEIIFDRNITDNKQDKNVNKSAKPDIGRKDIFRLRFLNAEKNPEIIPVDASEHKVSYFIGKNKSKWKTNIHTSESVLYKEVYSGINLKLYGCGNQLEYDWIVYPGGHAGDIEVELLDISSLSIDNNGNLFIKTEFGEYQHTKPHGYQAVNGKKIPLEIEFRKTGENSFGYKVGDHNPDYPLVIDPIILVYSSYFGSTTQEEVSAITVDSNGQIYLTGKPAAYFPLKNPYSAVFNSIFVSKLSKNGKRLIFSTYLGGSSLDFSKDIAVDSKGAVYITGTTFSDDFPVKKAFQKKRRGGTDAFITKLHPNGTSLVYSTYLGGDTPLFAEARGIAVDSKGAAYVIGSTPSHSFPIKNGFQKKYAGGLYDIFISKLKPNGKKLAYSTYLGGSYEDEGNSIAIDSKGNAYITGGTHSPDFPVVNSFQPNKKGWDDAFIAKISPTGAELVFSSYLGGYLDEEGRAIALNSKNLVFITGSVYSPPPVNDYDVFVASVSSNGQTLLYSMDWGGEKWDLGYGIVADSKGAAYVVGKTKSEDFPVKKPLYDTLQGDWDCFITKISPVGNNVLYSTYFGGSARDEGIGIAMGTGGLIFITGNTYSSDFPTKQAFMKDFGGMIDVFILKLRFKK